MNKLALVPTNQFKRDARKQFQMLLTAEWAEVLYCLINDKELPDKYCDHSLTGDFKDYRECHVKLTCCWYMPKEVTNCILRDWVRIQNFSVKMHNVHYLLLHCIKIYLKGGTIWHKQRSVSGWTTN